MVKTTRQKLKKTPAKKSATKTKSKPNGEGVLGRISSIQDCVDEGIKLAVYGRNGSGKTSLVGTFPKPMLLIDCHAGERSIRDIKGVERVVPEHPDDIKEIVELQKETDRWKTVALDHATAFQDLVMKVVLDVEELPSQLSWGVASQQQWGQIAAGMKERLRDLISLSCNVVIVAQEREFNTDSDSDLMMPSVGSAVSPSVAGYIGPAVDYYGQMFIRQFEKTEKKKLASGKVIKKRAAPEIQYCLRVGPHPVYHTKFRSPRGYKLPDVIVDPTYEKILAVADGKEA